MKEACQYCKHRQPKNICGFAESPFYNSTIDNNETTCKFFNENPAIQHANKGFTTIRFEDVLDESHINDAKIAIKEFETALKLGIPEDDELSVRLFAAQAYFMLMQHKMQENLDSNSEKHAAIQHIEAVAQKDKQGAYHFFFDDLNRALLAKFDFLYAVQINSVNKYEGKEEAIQYAEKKIHLFDYLPSTPLLSAFMAVGCLYAAKNDFTNAKKYWRSLLDAAPVADDENERKIRNDASRFLQEAETNNQSSNSDGGCYIATACYGSYDAPEVITLRKYRDEKLVKTRYGRGFIWFYYKYSPSLANKLKKRTHINHFVRTYILNFLVNKILKNGRR